MSYMAWGYYKLVNNRLVDSEYGGEANINFPSFYSDQEAEAYLLEHDIPATLVGGGPSIREVEPAEPKYPNYIMEKGRQSLGLVSYDASRDEEINIMSHNRVFEMCLEWEGIIGYGYTIRDWIKDIYGVTLE